MDDQGVIQRKGMHHGPTCGTLGTTPGTAAMPVSSTDAALSTIHTPYYHHPVLINILIGESDTQP